MRGSGGFRRPGDVVPGGEAVGHRGAIVIGGEPMAAGRKCGEITLNTARNRWAEPGMRNRFMARSRWRVGWCEFSARVVQVPRLPVLDRRHNRPMRRLIASELVGDQHPRYGIAWSAGYGRTAWRPWHPGEVGRGCRGRAVLVDGPPQVVTTAVDRQEHLVEVPLVAGSGLAAAQAGRVDGSELGNAGKSFQPQTDRDHPRQPAHHHPLLRPTARHHPQPRPANRDPQRRLRLISGPGRGFRCARHQAVPCRCQLHPARRQPALCDIVGHGGNRARWNPTLTDSGSRTAIRPNLVKSNRTLTPGVSCVVTNVLIPQIRSTSSWDGSAASKYRPIVSFTRRIADHVDGWVTNKSGSAYGCGTRAPANPSASR